MFSDSSVIYVTVSNAQVTYHPEDTKVFLVGSRVYDNEYNKTKNVLELFLF
jgi:hypothetical protein